jgi:hypothetical protein
MVMVLQTLLFEIDLKIPVHINKIFKEISNTN